MSLCSYSKEEKRLYNQRHFQKNKAYYYERNRRVHLRNKALLAVYKDKPCAECGVRYPRFVMDCHHRDPTLKEFNVSIYALTSTPRFKRELEKCDVLCANCHRIRTWIPENEEIAA